MLEIGHLALVHLPFSYICHIFYTFHPTPSLHIYIYVEYFPIPDDAVDRRKLGF